MLSLWISWLGLMIASLVGERWLHPRPSALLRRAPGALPLHVGILGGMHAVLLLLLQRPLFATVILLLMFGTLIQSSNVKQRMLKEPFIYQDLEYFIDAVRFPRLYVPFFGILNTILLLLGLVTFSVVGLWLEPSMLGTLGLAVWLSASATLLAMSLALILIGHRHLPTPSLDPEEDITHMGLLPHFWAYRRALRQPPALPQPDDTTSTAAHSAASSENWPHLVTVQSESFFDPRTWCPAIAPEVLANFDRLSQQATKSGALRVPVWGANTVRSETAFLTGLGREQLGVHAFNPYWLLAQHRVASLPQRLHQLGYRTLCLHPYPARFYQRHRVMPNLGFDEFIDIEAFDITERDGQYIGDLALARKIDELLAGPSEQPLFIFVITMENHGPLDLEPALPERERWFKAPLPRYLHELDVYLRHLNNADQMIAALQRSLRHAPRPGMLCWYGDHVPIMPEAYAELGEPTGHSDYAIWSTSDACDKLTTDQAFNVELDIHHLGTHLLQQLLAQRPAEKSWRSAPSTPYNVMTD